MGDSTGCLCSTVLCEPFALADQMVKGDGRAKGFNSREVINWAVHACCAPGTVVVVLLLLFFVSIPNPKTNRSQ